MTDSPSPRGAAARAALRPFAEYCRAFSPYAHCPSEVADLHIVMKTVGGPNEKALTVADFRRAADAFFSPVSDAAEAASAPGEEAIVHAREQVFNHILSATGYMSELDDGIGEALDVYVALFAAAQAQEIARDKDYEAFLSFQLDEAQEEAYALRQRLAEATRDIETGFMEGAYARLQHLQRAEAELYEVRQQLAEANEAALEMAHNVAELMNEKWALQRQLAEAREALEPEDQCEAMAVDGILANGILYRGTDPTLAHETLKADPAARHSARHMLRSALRALGGPQP